MYRNQYFYEGIPLGSSISQQDDIFKALREGEEKAGQIAKALAVKIPKITSGEIEIHCKQYDPQMWLDKEWAKKAETMKKVPGQKTLKTMVC